MPGWPKSSTAIRPAGSSATRTCGRLCRRSGGICARAVADVGPVKIPEDERRKGAVPFRYFSHRLHGGGILRYEPGDTSLSGAAVRSGNLPFDSAYLLGAERVIAIDRIPERLELARSRSAAIAVNYQFEDVSEALREITAGVGPDACIDAVGLEAHGFGLLGWYDAAKQQAMARADRPTALRQAIQTCRKGGTVSIPGVYGGFIDKFPMGAAFAKGLTLRMKTHVQKYAGILLSMVQAGQIDPSFIISHRLPLEEAPRGYEIFNNGAQLHRSWCSNHERCSIRRPGPSSQPPFLMSTSSRRSSDFR